MSPSYRRNVRIPDAGPIPGAENANVVVSKDGYLAAVLYVAPALFGAASRGGFSA